MGLALPLAMVISAGMRKWLSTDWGYFYPVQVREAYERYFFPRKIWW